MLLHTVPPLVTCSMPLPVADDMVNPLNRKHPHVVSISLSATGSAYSMLRLIEWCYSVQGDNAAFVCLYAFLFQSRPLL